MSRKRERLSVVADEIGVDFAGLFGHLCKVLPSAIDNSITIPSDLAMTLRAQAREARGGGAWREGIIIG